MEHEVIIESLSPIERKIFPSIENSINLEDLSKKAETDKTTTLRAIEFLEKKGLVKVEKAERNLVDLGLNGILYKKKGLPERRLFDALLKENSILLGEVSNISGLNQNEAKVSVGTLKKKSLVEIENGKVILKANDKEKKSKFLEEEFLEKLPLSEEKLKPEEKFCLENLKKRKDIIFMREVKEINISLTELGKVISKKELSGNFIEQLNSKMISSESWKGKKFRRYDIKSEVPNLIGGKRYFVNQATDYAKKIWLEMGFREMKGDMIVSSFWNFDALFTPQDHPARELQDTFFIKDQEATLPDKKVVQGVKEAHEGRLNENSKGWSSEWKEQNAKGVLLRTHTTCLSAQTLQKIAETKEFPAKYFALGKCFRNETLDWSHGFEFNQTEGIVVDENANFRQLLGYLVAFYKKMGFKKIRFRPHYFPYTEPSVEIDGWHNGRKCWVEIGGAGMFRPEVTIPFFGKHIPVLAWGPGFDRMIMETYEIKDLREMYKNNITKLREIKYWPK